MSDGDVITYPVTPDLPHALGRNVNHDPAHRNFALPQVDTLPSTSFRHRRYGACVNQGQIGQCVIGATAHVFNCHPFRASFSARKLPCFTSAWLLPRYEEVTAADPYQGAYPPDDTGTDAESSMKVAQSHGEVVGYDWAFGALHGLATLPQAPLMQGTVWTDRMFECDSDGRVHYQGEPEVGGHETVVLGYEIRSKVTQSQNRVWCLNDWSTPEQRWGYAFSSSGIGNYFYLTLDEWEALIANNGDLVRPRVA